MTERWTEADVMKQNAKFQRVKTDTALEPTTLPAKPSKYRNVKTVVNGERFDSQREATVWIGLLARQSAGEITELRRQVAFPLYTLSIGEHEGFIVPNQPIQMIEVARYVADFTFVENDELVVVDAKGRRITPYALKKKWLWLQQRINIVEV